MPSKDLVYNQDLVVVEGGSFTIGAIADMNDANDASYRGKWDALGVTAGGSISSICWFPRSKIQEVKLKFTSVGGGRSGGYRQWGIQLYFNGDWQDIIYVETTQGTTTATWISDDTGWSGVTGMKAIVVGLGRDLQIPYSTSQGYAYIYEMQAWGAPAGGYHHML